MRLPISPSQTIGPFSHEAWQWACSITRDAPRSADAVSISGILVDGAGAPINDAMIEFWAPHAAAAEADHALPGFRRTPTDDAGTFRFQVPRPAAGEPAALVTLFARGLVLHQFTAVFLDDDPHAAILAQVQAARRATLVAQSSGERSYTWNIAMQGPAETVFFDYAGPA